jgi:hypothetical protein
VLIEGFTRQVAALDVPPSVRVDVTPDTVTLNGQPVAREEAAAALEAAIVRCLASYLACPVEAEVRSHE